MSFAALFDRPRLLDPNLLPHEMEGSCEADCPRRDFQHWSATDEVGPFLDDHDFADYIHNLICHEYTGDLVEALDQLIQVGLGGEGCVLEVLAQLAQSYYALALKHLAEERIVI
jgi:hypothetical protein